MSHDVRRRGAVVPKQALLLSLLSLWVPVLSSAFFPDWTGENVGVLVWLLALVPGFLLSYYRGWKGASVALAGGMAAFSVAQALAVATHATVPPPEVLMGVVTVLTTVSLGSGVISTLFRRALERAEQMALTDPGTGMPNRRHALMELERAFAAAERGDKLSVVLFDLDYFKRVNDGWGHAEGDRVLAGFAAVLRASNRAMNLAARFGGEEFVAVLRSSEAPGAAVFAERVRTELRKQAFPCGTVTVSAGVAEYEPGMPSPDVLLAAADQALYRAKNTGRDRVVVLSRQGRLPDGPGAPPSKDEQDVPMGRGERVLVVDDDFDALHSVANALRRFGYAVFEAPSPAQAVDIARGLSDPLDLVLTDIVMPEMGGFRLVEILGETQGGVRVIYMSGYSQEDVDWAGVPGVHGYLSKPISIYTLARMARALLDQPVSSAKVASGLTSTL
jgi:diguanylate cyclase (GGDEF)-like protein